jgi:hypothetical protein
MIHEVIEGVEFENESIKVCDTVVHTYTKAQPHVLANPCIEYKGPASLPQYQLPFQLQMPSARPVVHACDDVRVLLKSLGQMLCITCTKE